MMRVAPEGWPFLVPGWGLVAVGAWGARSAAWLWGPEAVVTLLAIWLVVFFRDPKRSGPRGEGFVIAPADGRIVDVRVVDEPMYLPPGATDRYHAGLAVSWWRIACSHALRIAKSIPLAHPGSQCSFPPELSSNPWRCGQGEPTWPGIATAAPPRGTGRP